MSSSTTVSAGRLLDVIEHDVLPLTADGVAAGNKIFGAAILRKSDFSVVIAETNNELENPLWHGEMHALKRFYELPESERPPTEALIFLSTHEPCSLCLSAITWAGFDNFFYFFSHEDSRDEFAIPHDLKILKEVFSVEPGQYNRQNEFWQAHNVIDMAAADDNAEALAEQIKQIKRRYEQLSTQYQTGKSDNNIPLK
jgi:tRNA(Arg) A34 adenosine deaminase TadA